MKRKNRLRREKLILPVLMCFSLGFTMPVPAAEREKQAIADSKEKISASKEKITSLEKEQKKVNEAIKSLEALKSDAREYIAGLDRQMAEINAELDAINDSIVQKQADIAFTQDMLAKAMQKRLDQYASMKLRVKYMYEKGDTGFIDMFLNAKSWSELLNRTEYIRRITEYDREKLETYQKTQEEITAIRQQLDTENAQLLEIEEAAELKQQSIQRLIDEKASEIRTFNQKIEKAEAQVDKTKSEIINLQEEIRRQEAEIVAMEREIERQEAEARKKAEAEGKTYTARELKGGLIWPCPSSSRITSEFGSRESPTEGASSNHKGIDIGAPSGEKVIAAAGGEVVISTYSASAGNYIMISHGSGIYTVYMHMSALLVSEGEEVSQGQTIGKVGSTGYSTGPHLHFGVRKNGSYVDPLQFVG